MFPSFIPALIVTQQQKERDREEEERREQERQRKVKNSNPNLYSCSTPNTFGSCTNNGNSFKK